MGACLNIMEVDGKATKDQVVAGFNARCEQDDHESGHSCSGSFSEFRGLRFTGQEFVTYEEAEGYISDHGEKWGPAVAVRFTVVEPSKRMLNLDKQIGILRQKIYDAQRKLRNAQDKMRINNRSVKPTYIVKAEDNFKKVKELNEWRIGEKEAKRKTIEQHLAAKSKKFRWMIGGWCSS